MRRIERLGRPPGRPVGSHCFQKEPAVPSAVVIGGRRGSGLAGIADCRYPVRIAMKSLPCLLTIATAVGALFLTEAALAQAPAPGHFGNVAKHLETGGVFYSIMDIDGDLQQWATAGDALLELVKEQAGGALPSGLSATGLLKALGLEQVKALGMSSKRTDHGLFHNRALIFLPEGRRGIFKLFGGAASPLQSPAFAPEGSDLVLESEVTPSALLEIVEAVLRHSGNEAMLQQYEALLKFPVPGLEMMAKDFIARLDTRILVAGRLEKNQTFTPPGSPMTLPAFRLVVGFDQLGFLMAPLKEYAKQAGGITLETGEGFELLKPAHPLPEEYKNFAPVVYHDLKSGRLLLGSHVEAIRDCLGSGAKVSSDAAFVGATAGLPMDANEFSYVTPAVFEAVRQLMQGAMKHRPALPGGPPDEVVRQILSIVEKFSPPPAVPIAGIRANLPDGMLFRGNQTTSFKSLLALPVVITTAIAAGTSFGSYQSIRKNLEAAPAGAPEDQKPPAVPKAADKAEPAEADAGDAGAIRNNLQQIAFAAQTWFLDRTEGNEVSYEQLVAAELLFRIEPVDGESYKGLKFKRGGGTATVKLPNGAEVSRRYGPVTD